MYRVIVRFVDLQDSNHVYHPGEVFPREGKRVSSERIAELSGPYNKRGMPLIEEVVEQATPIQTGEQNVADVTEPILEEGEVVKTEPTPATPKPRAKGGRKKK